MVLDQWRKKYDSNNNVVIVIVTVIAFIQGSGGGGEFSARSSGGLAVELCFGYLYLEPRGHLSVGAITGLASSESSQSVP